MSSAKWRPFCFGLNVLWESTDSLKRDRDAESVPTSLRLYDEDVKVIIVTDSIPRPT